ncbi:MAG: hypothetical protein HYY25_15310 [Candidatus Wallbacteria bacterium]|nr:hypothetical protein [Candidatus Wallbacteria bacterium]
MAGETDPVVNPVGRLLSLTAVVLIVAIASELLAVYALDEELAPAVAVRVRAQAGRGLEGVEAIAVGPGGGERAMRRAGGASEWSSGGWVRRIRLEGPASAVGAIESVEVSVGERSWRWAGEALAAWRPRNSVREVLESPPALGTEQALAPQRLVLNWPAWGTPAGGLLLWPLLLATVFFVLSLTARLLWSHPVTRPVLAAAFGLGEPATSREPVRDRPWLAAGLATVCAGLAILEWNEPFYFLQDDNFVQFMPSISLAGRTLLEGRWPSLNPHILLGAPLFDNGNYALTYPPVLASWWLARTVLGNEYWTLDVFCCAHVIAAFFAAYWLARAVGVGPHLSAAAAVSHALSGYVLISGRSWLSVTPAAFYYPLMALATVRFVAGGAGIRWAVSAGCMAGLAFHAGNVQFWLYAVILCGLVLALHFVCGNLEKRSLLLLVPAALLTTGIAAPLLIPQMGVASDLIRKGGTGRGILVGLHALVLPYPVVEARHPNNWGNTHRERMGQYYYCGTFVSAPGLLLVVLAGASLGVLKRPRRFVAANVWLLAGGLALLCALGREGLIWQWMSALPIVGKFREPFKFLLFVTMLIPLSGALGLERVLGGGRRGARTALAAVTALAMLYHCAIARPVLRSYFAKPYPVLGPRAEAFARPVPGEADGFRILTLAEQCDVQRDAPWAWLGGIPTAYGRCALFGYDPLVRQTPEFQQAHAALRTDTVAAARAYGVRWVIVHDPPGVVDLTRQAVLDWVNSPRADVERMSQALRPHVREVARQGRVALWELPGADPAAFVSGQPQLALPVRMHGAGVSVDLSRRTQGGAVVVNVLARAHTRAWAAGRELLVDRDDRGRVRVVVPAGAPTLEVGYLTRWQRDLLLGSLLVLTGLAAAVVLARYPGLTAGGSLP